MKPRTVFARLMVSYTFLMLVTILVISAFLNYLFTDYVMKEKEKSLVTQGREIARLMEDYFGGQKDLLTLGYLLNTLDYFLDARIWVVDRTGLVFAASQRTSSIRGVRLSQDEVRDVLGGKVVRHWGRYPRLNVATISVAVPVAVGERVVGAVFLHAPLTGIQATLVSTRRLVLSSALVGLFLAAVVAYWMSRGISRPLREMSSIAQDMAKGNFSRRVAVNSFDEIGQLAETFNHAVDELARTMEQQVHLEKMRRDFVANVSHEFRAPLASLRGYLELMSEGAIPEGEKSRYLGFMLEDTMRLNRLVDDLLDLSRIDAGQLPLDIQDVDTSKIIEEVQEHFRPELERSGLRFKVAGGSPPRVRADAGRFYQILTNLIGNAIRFTPRGGEIALSWDEGDQEATFYISDTGIGIEPADLPYIWDRFYKADKARTPARSGTGLGLAIVKELVELQGGHVAVNSSPGKGSTFIFTLPRS